MPHQRLEVVPAVAVEQHELANVVPPAGGDDLADHRIQHVLGDVDGHGKTHQVAVHAER